jgi:hypothetical protein
MYDRELLAIIYALKEFRHICAGATHEIEILTNHANLRFFITGQTLNRRQAQWSIFLSNFNFEIVHTSGSMNARADALSRRQYYKRGIEHNNEKVVLLPQDLFINMVLEQNNELLEKIKKATKDTTINDSYRWIYQKLRQKEILPYAMKTLWKLEGGLLEYREKIYIPQDNTLRREIIRMHHSSLQYGHPGVWKMVELIQ